MKGEQNTLIKMNLVKKAEEFATKAHTGQFRKDGKTPYIKHCEGVVKLLKGIGIEDENIIAAGWLHDVVEDCNINIEIIEREFNFEIARIVIALTRNCSREEYKERMKKTDYSIQIIKLADMVHNCSELNEDLKFKTVVRKIDDNDKLYLEMAERICPEFYELLMKYIKYFRYKLSGESKRNK